MLSRRLALLAALACILVLAPAAHATDPPAPDAPGVGAPSAGDRLFPQIGNGGYDALHYDLRLAYDPATTTLDGRVALTARATQRLRAFSLDLQGFEVSEVSVDGEAANFTRAATKLLVEPVGRRIRLGSTFRVQVRYRGVPEPVTDPDGSREGWFATDDGAFVVGEPIGSQGWFPNNNTPADKATYDVRTSVPAGLTVVGNFGDALLATRPAAPCLLMLGILAEREQHPADDRMLAAHARLAIGLAPQVLPAGAGAGHAGVDVGQLRAGH